MFAFSYLLNTKTLKRYYRKHLNELAKNKTSVLCAEFMYIGIEVRGTLDGNLKAISLEKEGVNTSKCESFLAACYGLFRFDDGQSRWGKTRQK